MYNSILNQTVFPQTIAIIGGGLSGSLVAANLLRSATIPISIKLIERNDEIGKGVAYGTRVDGHLLNVPAGKMSAFPDESDHFLKWLHANGYKQVSASTFVPRTVYGNYIQAILQEAQAKAQAGVEFERIVGEAISIDTTTYSVRVYLNNGRRLQVQKAVLALGNFPASLPEPQKRFLRHVKAYWEVHRHRIAEEIAEVLDTAVQSGQLRHYGGRIQTCQEFEKGVNVTIRERETRADIVLQVSRIVNCTGSNCNYRRLQHPLLSSLQEQRLFRSNTLSIAIDTAANGALIDADGKVSELLYTLGTPRKGNLWETTAVR
ncbi:hypothetical protein WA1_25905 [Scytonema hofmannii PCC 7110]|uniref:FAD-dependent urate hydroxylase HpyO/Asp monooxygenase CreE-like FAD/NAD(P)-binding domain-containing protein n=1 Tax=Scytonema hofmannii PCC 7110 TaxID=128403 RepID=A0A139X781_9CYAN|nr:FAD/NAD(P)-binding domain-containing protein [Scytonema hofmannii]KYC40558.1 hypothetical protein WA1_25905 [Scytonema hofmannii PCC 7110]